FEEMIVRADLDRAVADVADGERDRLAGLVELDLAAPHEHCAADHGSAPYFVSVMSRRTSTRSCGMPMIVNALRMRLTGSDCGRSRAAGRRGTSPRPGCHGSSQERLPSPGRGGSPARRLPSAAPRSCRRARPPG